MGVVIEIELYVQNTPGVQTPTRITVTDIIEL